MPQQHAATYLNDHLSGSVAAIDVLDYLMKSHAGTPVAELAAGLKADILEDRQQLEALIDRLGLKASAPRQTAAWLTHKLGELKLRLDDSPGGDLRLLESLDLVSIGIEGKRLLWKALEHVAETVPSYRGLDYPELIRRAEEQRARLEATRLAAARASIR